MPTYHNPHNHPVDLDDGTIIAAGGQGESSTERADELGLRLVEQGAPPPRAGAGSGRDAWAAYADRNAIEYGEEATRDEIIAALEDAGVTTDKEN